MHTSNRANTQMHVRECVNEWFCCVFVRAMTRFASSWRVTRSILKCRWDQIHQKPIICVWSVLMSASQSSDHRSVEDPRVLQPLQRKEGPDGVRRGAVSLKQDYKYSHLWRKKTHKWYIMKRSVAQIVLRFYRTSKTAVKTQRFLLLKIFSRLFSNMPTRGHQKTSEKI